MAGSLTLTFDDQAVTTLARWGAKVSHPHWPAIAHGIEPESITARMSPGGRIDFTGHGFPPMMLHPSIDSHGAINLQVRGAPESWIALFNFLAPWVNHVVAKALNERIAALQRDLAAMGLHLRLSGVGTGSGLLTLTGTIGAGA